jgi:phage shock protein E
VRILIFVALVACSKSEPKQTPSPPAVAAAKAIDPARARTLIENGAVVIDVRTPEEFAEGHLDKAINMPVQTFEPSEVDKLTHNDKAKPIVVHCAAGARAAKAKAKLEEAGYRQVVNGGGLDDLR